MNSGGSIAVEVKRALLTVCLCLGLGCFGGRGAAAASSSDVPRSAADTPSLSSPAPNIRQTGSNTFRIGHVEFDKDRRTVSIPCRVRLRNEMVEYALVSEQGKGYESLLTTGARPSDVHLAFLLLGLGAVSVGGEPGTPAPVPETNAVRIEVSWHTNGHIIRFALSDLVLLTSGRPDPAAPRMRTENWLYNGSVMNSGGFAAQREGSIVSLIRDPAALINNPGRDRDNDTTHFPNTGLLPPEGAAVSLTVSLPERVGNNRP